MWVVDRDEGGTDIPISDAQKFHPSSPEARNNELDDRAISQALRMVRTVMTMSFLRPCEA